MSQPVEILRKRLQFRCWHRGTRELDLLLGRFADFILPQWDESMLIQFDDFLQENDPDIYNWITGQTPAPPHINHHILDTIRHYYT